MLVDCYLRKKHQKTMKKNLLYTLALATALFSTSCGGDDDNTPAQQPEAEPVTKWVVVWQEDFNSGELDTRYWSTIPEGTPDWQKYQSSDPRCYEFRDGMIVLKGIVNNDPTADKREYLCGGIWTLGKKEIRPGSKVEVRARLPKGAQGAWPAIWMMPWSPSGGWPACGEIDILERLNNSDIVYQTVHSAWTEGGNKNDPPSSVNFGLDVDQFHTYSVTILKDEVIFAVDGIFKLAYPNVNHNRRQYPYYQSWELRIDMQLGGSWVGGYINAWELPVEMEVDWVKVSEPA